MEDFSFACNFEVTSILKTGSVYKVYDGTFGYYPSVLVKQTSSWNREHAILAKNDIAMMQRLSGSENIARILHFEDTSDITSLIVERYEFNLLRYLKLLVVNGETLCSYDEPTIFRQVFAALSFMHGRMIAHRDVKLKNVYILKVSNSVWCVKLGGLKYAKSYDEDWIDEYVSDSSSPGPKKVDACKISDDFNNDIYQVAVMMYFFLKRSYSKKIFAETFTPDWTDEKGYGSKKLHMKHLIKMIHSNPSLGISDIQHHPYFMSVDKMITFEDELRIYSARNPAMDSHLEVNRTNVFTGRWTAKLEPKVVSLCLANSQNLSVSEETFVGLWQSTRNLQNDCDEDRQWMLDFVGRLEADNFAFWERVFPAFFLHLFTRIASYKSNSVFLCSSTQFKNSIFFPASPEFYAACANTSIYED